MRKFPRLPFLTAALFLSMLVCVPTSHGYLQEHLDYDGCDGCHSYHGSASGFQLLAGVDTEATCKACHGATSPVVASGTAPEAAVHDPAGVGVGNQGYVSCRECHDNHDNEGNNTKLVGYDWDPEVDPSKSTVFAGPTIRVELTTSDINSPVYKDVTFEVRPDDFKRPDNAGVCEVCHNAGPTSGPTVLQDHEWGDCVICHMHEDGFKKRQCVECHDVNASLVDDAPKILDKGAASNGNVGSHLQVPSLSNTLTSRSDEWWTERCIQCHTGHSGDVIIPNYNSVGIDYQKTGGIGLGGKYDAATDYTSEAEICWGCHGAGQSEWNGQAHLGYNVSTENWITAVFDAPNGGSSSDVIPDRPTRSIHTANPDELPEGTDTESDVRSSSVADNVDGNGELPSSTWVPTSNSNSEVLEKVKYIRCSYCHDVHNTFGPDKGVTISSNNPNAPIFTNTYLRGTWLPNPYVGRSSSGVTNKPEVPPWNSGDLYYGTTTGNFTRNGTAINPDDGNNWGHTYDGDASNRVNFPRLYATSVYSTYEGGFFIDQNSSWPTSSFIDTVSSENEVDDTAGLCVLCHGNDTDTMDYYTGSSLWRTGTNGHSNSALGGSGAGADIFNGRRDLSDSTEYSMYNQVAVDFQGVGERRWGSSDGYQPLAEYDPDARDFLPFGEGFQRLEIDDVDDWAPPFNTGWYGGTAGIKERDSTGDYDNWFFDGQIGSHNGSSTRAHDFSCSKCHTPHASGLPALLVTNCLDTDVATWSATGQTDRGDDITVGPNATDAWARRAAGNCHRKEWWSNTANGNDPANNTGWHKLAPGQ